MLQVLNSPDWRQVIFGRYRNGKRVQKEGVEMHQDQPPCWFSRAILILQATARLKPGEAGISKPQPAQHTQCSAWVYSLGAKDELYI